MPNELLHKDYPNSNGLILGTIPDSYLLNK